MEENENKGIVTSIRLSGTPSENIYSIMSNKVMQTKSNLSLELYENVKADDGKLDLLAGKSTGKDYDALLGELVERVSIDENIKSIDLRGKPYGQTALMLMQSLKDAAMLLCRAFISGAPIVVRFHNDGDGSTGGIALYRAFCALQEKFFANNRSISWQMNRSIAYTLESFYADKMLFDSYESIERPLVIITDFGTSPESSEAIKAASGVCDLIWLDHHVPYGEFPRQMIGHYINVFDFGGNSSFTAGLLTCIFAQVLSNVDVEDLKQAALVSDYSKYADAKSEKAAKDSLILDYLTSSGNEMLNKPKQMDLILKDGEKSETTYRTAKALLEEAISTGMKNIESHRNADGINICMLDFSHVARLRLEYPLPGRFSSKLQESLEAKNGGHTITVVYYGSYISLRSSSDITSITMTEIIERLKAQNSAVSGGGHKQAASIRTDREHMKEVTLMLLRELGIN
jgi:RecJ-like exonuclease